MFSFCTRQKRVFVSCSFDHTVKYIGLDLGPSIGKLVEGVTGVISNGSVLYRCNNIHKYIVLLEKQENLKFTNSDIYISR